MRVAIQGAGDRSTAFLRRSLRWAAVLAVFAGVIAGCSSVRFGYDNADTLLFYKLDGYVDLSNAQSRLVRDKVRGLFAWHRATQLPGYADFIDGASRQLDDRVTPAEIYALNVEINRRLLAIGEHAAPDLAALALTLEPRQIDRLAARMADDDAKVRQETPGPGRRGTEQRVKRAVGNVEDWFGSANPQQREFIRATLATRTDRDEAWMVERAQRRADLLNVVRRIHAERPAPELAAQWIRDYFASMIEPPDAERRMRMQGYRRDNADLIAGLVNAATPEQKAALRRKLHGYADDFMALAGVRASRS